MRALTRSVSGGWGDTWECLDRVLAWVENDPQALRKQQSHRPESQPPSNQYNKPRNGRTKLGKEKIKIPKESPKIKKKKTRTIKLFTVFH